MNEFRRWLDDEEAPRDLVEVLRSAPGARPLDDATRRRTRRQLVALTAAPAAAGVFLWLQPLAWGAALGTVLSVALIQTRPARKEVVPVVTASTARAPNRVRREPLAPPPSSAAVSKPTPESTSRIIASPPLAASVSPEPTLVREAKLLEQARRAIGSDPNLALGLLTQHTREFPDGSLALERDFLSVEALVRVGRRAEAERLAAQLRKRAPGSLYDQRLNRLLGAQ